MKKFALAIVAAGMLSTSAMSAPLLNQSTAVTQFSLVTDVRVVCDVNGYCYQLRSRQPVARWIYGSDAFYGPYDGPRYYGDPARRYKWSFFSPWTW